LDFLFGEGLFKDLLRTDKAIDFCIFKAEGEMLFLERAERADFWPEARAEGGESSPTLLLKPLLRSSSMFLSVMGVYEFDRFFSVEDLATLVSLSSAVSQIGSSVSMSLNFDAKFDNL
jgi:hypothetical protein